MAYVEKRGKDSFRLVVPVGFDSKGKRIRKTKTVKCKNKTEAEKELAKFVVEIETGEYIAPQKMTFPQFVEEWKDKYAKKQLSANTFETYSRYLYKRILPQFGHKQMEQIKPLQILDFLKTLEEDGSRGDDKTGGLSSATIQYHYRILRNIFNRAVEWKVIKENPVSNVKKPKVESKKGNVYSEKQVHELMEHLRKEDMKWKMIVTLAITTGMRRGEILALEWSHIDLDKGKIYVQQSLTYTKEEGHIFKAPKTRNSIRTISLSQGVTEQLKRYKQIKAKERLLLGDKWEGGDRFLLFSTDIGKPMHPTSVTSWWRKRLKKYELPSITFHELRHTSATLLINQGVHMKTISARLGHSKIGITMDLYGHALESADEAAASHFDSLFEGKKNNA
ncbi:site-specific integrase [Bacillus cabrialesii]|uniref:site-specific integrase n=1 Tax=Bacillus cabrialesii TaxID=2487276 RepID=UPI00101156CA|nr:site-specific integrase [Bacillus cabrialesii]UQE80241.1 site-specific integrase [Bacillus cabrialesii]